MTRRHHLATIVDANLNDATIAAAYIQDALDAIDTAKGGHPTSTPGANPGTPPQPTIVKYDETGQPVRDTNTATERAALNPDQAVSDEKRLRKAIHAANTQLQTIATITQKWATPSLDGSTIRERLATIDADLWCINHLRYGMREPRRTHNDTCELCGDFRVRYKRDAPLEVLDYQARHGRLYETQIRLLLAIADTRLKAEREERKATERAARDENVSA